MPVLILRPVHHLGKDYVLAGQSLREKARKAVFLQLHHPSAIHHHVGHVHLEIKYLKGHVGHVGLKIQGKRVNEERAHLRPSMTTKIQSQPLHLLVKRNPWEPKHEWESRLLFVEDNLDRHGLEKAIHLSLVWANVNFLGCSYPSHTQLLVSDYSVPDQKLLESERRTREMSERKRKASLGGGGGSGGGVETEVVAAKKARKQTDQSSGGGVDPSHDSSADDTDASFEHITQQVDALISAIRKQHEQKASEQRTKKCDGAVVPDEVLKMLHSMCMCDLCFCPGTSPSSQVNSIIQRYVARFDKSFTHDFTFSEFRGTTECRFLINGQLVSEGSDETKKAAKQSAAEQFVRLVNCYYNDNGKPCCPHEPGKRK